MDEGLLPRRYAKALYKYASEKGISDQMYTLMQNLAKGFADNHELKSVIANPFVKESDKKALLITLAGADNQCLDDFIKLLGTNNRLDIVRDIAIAYAELYRKENNIYQVKITSAATLNEADRKRLTDMIEKHIGDATAEYTFDVNPDLIGGFVVTVNNERLDASVRNELEELRKSLIS